MKTIRIPKTDKDVWVEIIKSQTTKCRITLKRQIICGVEIPKNSTIDTWTDDCDFNTLSTMAFVSASKINKLLRYLFLDYLRKGI